MAQLRAMIKADLIQRMGGDISGDFATMDVASILITYLNWRARFIPPHPRRVHLSRELLSSSKYAEHRPAIDAIVAKIATGEDLTAHLSKDIGTVHVARAKRPSGGGGRSDLDRLIAEWGIHHLHLSLAVQNNGFVTRTGDLLFAYFAADDAFLIGVFPHGSWARLQIAAVTVRNWPGANIFTPLNGVLGLEEAFSDEDRLRLRRAGLSTPFGIDGRVWMASRGGQSTAGTPMWVTTDSNVLMHSLNQLRDLDDAGLRTAIIGAGGDLGGAEPKLAPETDGEIFRIRDSVTGTVVWEAAVIG